MKRLAIIAASTLIVCACGNNGNNRSGGVSFTPKTQETVVTKGPSIKDVNDPLSFEGCVKLMIMLPEGLPESSEALLRNKIVHITAINNVGSLDGSPIFIIVPTIAEINHDITATVPAKHKVKYTMAIYVANLKSGDIFGSVEQEMLGIGDSGELALNNAISSISPGDDKYQTMLKTAQERIFAYYEANGSSLISEAKSLAAVNNFEEAITVLNSFPKSCTCYKNALEAKNEIQIQYFVNNGNILVSKMKAAMASPKDNEDGFSEEFTALYVMVPANSPAKKEADALYAEYQKSLDKAAMEKMARLEKEWQLQQRQIAIDSAMFVQGQAAQLEAYKAELNAKVAIEGQTALLEKYKKDAGYQKLGWLWRKVLYIGKE